MRYTIFRRGGYGQGVVGTTGGEVSGKLYLFRDPIGELEASTKNYVDLKLSSLQINQFNTGVMSADVIPEFTGDLEKSAGNSGITVKSTGVVEGSYSKVTVNLKGQVVNASPLTEDDIPSVSWSDITLDKPTTLAGYGIDGVLTTSGGVFTGTLKVSEVGLEVDSLFNKKTIDSLSINSRGLLPGSIVYRNNDVTPNGFLRCNGGVADRTVYPALYNAIGDQYSSNLIKGFGKPWEHQHGMNSSGSNFGSTKDSFPDLPLASPIKIISTNTRLYLFYPNAIYASDKDATGLPTTWFRVMFSGGTIHSIRDVVIKDNYMYVLTSVHIRWYDISNPDVSATLSVGGTVTTGVFTLATNIFTTKDKIFITNGYRYAVYNIEANGGLTLFKNVTLTIPGWNGGQLNVDGNGGNLSDPFKVTFIVNNSNKVTVVILPKVRRVAVNNGNITFVYSGSLIVTYTAELDSQFNFTNITTPVVKLTTGNFSSYDETFSYNGYLFYTTRDLATDMVVTNDAIYYVGGGRYTKHYSGAGNEVTYEDYTEQDRYILKSTIDANGVVSAPALLNATGGFYKGVSCISNRRLLLAGGIETGTQYAVSPQLGSIGSVSLTGTSENTAVPILDYDEFTTGEGISFIGNNSFVLPDVTPTINGTYAFVRY